MPIPTLDRRFDADAWRHTLERFDELVAKMRQVFVMKDRAYALTVPFANIRRSTTIGIPASTACFIRLTDKFSRIESLLAQAVTDPDFAAHAQADDESMVQNMFDLGVYAIIWQLLRAKEQEQAVVGDFKTKVATECKPPTHIKVVDSSNDILPCGCVGICIGHRDIR